MRASASASAVRRGWPAAGVASAVALVLAGCGGAASRPRSTTAETHPRIAQTRTYTAGMRPRAADAAKLAQAQRTHEYPTPPVRQTVTGGWRTPAAAVQAFATAYINWSAATVATRLQALASASVGQARSALRVGADRAARDADLRRGGIANSGTVEAIARLPGHPLQYAVVTRERTTAAHSDAYSGLAPAWHVALATVTRTSGGLWVLSRWQPES